MLVESYQFTLRYPAVFESLDRVKPLIDSLSSELYLEPNLPKLVRHRTFELVKLFCAKKDLIDYIVSVTT